MLGLFAAQQPVFAGNTRIPTFKLIFMRIIREPFAPVTGWRAFTPARLCLRGRLSCPPGVRNIKHGKNIVFQPKEYLIHATTSR